MFVQFSEALLSPRQVTLHDCLVDCDKVVMCLGAMDPYSAVSSIKFQMGGSRQKGLAGVKGERRK